MTMTNDPDLDQAIEQFAAPAKRLRLLQRQIAEADEVKEYRNLASRKHELAELTESFNARGEKLKLADDRALAGRALLMVVEEASRLWDRRKRKPNFLALYDALRITAATHERLRNEAVTEAVLVDYARKVAAHNAAATSSAIQYLEASR